MRNYLQHRPLYVSLAFIVVGVLYVFFPTHNSTLDAYHYAANVKFGQDLFSPHHLLYNAFLYVVVNVITPILPNLEVLAFSKLVNAFFVVASLVVLFKILIKLKLKTKESLLLVLLVAFSYNTMRFGTENETYIIPVFLSISGSFFFLKYLEKPLIRYMLFSGLAATMASLFHQIHFFWWLGLFIGVVVYVKQFKAIVVYAVSALLVPAVYIAVLYFYNHEPVNIVNLMHFVFHDYYAGSARSEMGLMNVILILISSVRSFFQVHQSALFLIRKNLVFAIPLVVLAFWLIQAIKLMVQRHLLVKRPEINTVFFKTSVIVLILHVLFAFYSVGNVEFLVMLPLLTTLTLLYYFRFNQRFLKVTLLLLLVWNFMFGIYPNNRFTYYNDDFLVDFIIKHPNDVFLVENPDLINRYYYATGVDNYDKIILKESVKSNATIDS
ncbi:MAG: hypothetical protein CR968_05080, partial [Flavobacteriia bacterium]